MAPTSYSLQNMFADLSEFQEAMAEVHAGLSNPEDKAKLGELLEQLQKARAEAEEKVPAILKKKLENAQKEKAELEDLAKQISQKQEELEAKEKEEAEKKEKELEAKKLEEAAAAKPEGVPKPEDQKVAAKPGLKVPTLPSLPEVPIDLNLGQDLRVELLKAYGGLITKDGFA